jgi:hypothetical protein
VRVFLLVLMIFATREFLMNRGLTQHVEQALADAQNALIYADQIRGQLTAFMACRWRRTEGLRDSRL